MAVSAPSTDEYIPSPVRHGRHSHPHTRLVAWLANSETATPGVPAGDNGTIRLDLDNEPQPDAFLIIRPEQVREPQSRSRKRSRTTGHRSGEHRAATLRGRLETVRLRSDAPTTWSSHTQGMP